MPGDSITWLKVEQSECRFLLPKETIFKMFILSYSSKVNICNSVNNLKKGSICNWGEKRVFHPEPVLEIKVEAFEKYLEGSGLKNHPETSKQTNSA